MMLGGAGLVATSLPLFLTGAMAVQLMDDLGFGLVGLGLAVATFRSTAAITSVFLGRLVDSIGATRSIRLASLLAAVCGIGIATTVTQLATLVAWLALGGVALATAQPGANRLLTNLVDPKRLGFAVGIKQSAPPLASMMAGLAVPLIAVTVGWRWGFMLAGVIASVLFISTTPSPTKPDWAHNMGSSSPPRLQNPRVIVLLAVAFAMGISTSTVVTTFYVDAASVAGMSPEFAGTTLAVASIAAIASRILGGYISDQIRFGHLKLCAIQLGIGTVGILLLVSGTEWLMAIGVLIALIGAWGFNGVFWYALVRSHPSMPGRITGAVSPGGHIGSTIGPLAFGVIVERFGYATSWVVVSGFALAAAGAMLIGNRLLNQMASGPTMRAL